MHTDSKLNFGYNFWDSGHGVEIVKFHLNNACFSVAMSPTCTVDITSAAATVDVTYHCSAMPVCGSINVSLTIENNGSVQASGSNSVTWTVMIGLVANSNVTCMSTVQCPPVDSEFVAVYRKFTSISSQLLFSKNLVSCDTERE